MAGKPAYELLDRRLRENRLRDQASPPLRRTAPAPTQSAPRTDQITMAEGSGTKSPESENAALNVGAGSPPMMSVPARSQSGSSPALRIHAWRSGKIGVPLTIGLSAESQRF